MMNLVKIIARKVMPKIIRHLILGLWPRIEVFNTYLLKRTNLIESLHEIDDKYLIRQLNIQDIDKLKEAYGNRDTFEKSILPRFKNPAWVAMAVISSTNGDIAYVSWVIKENIEFINEFKITLKKNQYFLRHGYCVPEYRHQGLHTRMEQERINYCIRNGANENFIQIGNRNKNGIASVKSNGYVFSQKNHILRIPRFGIYREFFSAIKSPFKRVI